MMNIRRTTALLMLTGALCIAQGVSGLTVMAAETTAETESTADNSSKKANTTAKKLLQRKQRTIPRW